MTWEKLNATNGGLKFFLQFTSRHVYDSLNEKKITPTSSTINAVNTRVAGRVECPRYLARRASFRWILKWRNLHTSSRSLDVRTLTGDIDLASIKAGERGVLIT